MKRQQRLHVFSLVLGIFLIANSGCSHAQVQKEQFQPHSGQPGKDVVWVPTPNELVETMLNLAKVTKDDYLMDLGSGDGRTVIAAAKRGAKALGIEYNPAMVELSIQNAKTEGVSEKARFIKADLFETDFSEPTVITMFLLSSINLKLRPKILDLKPGTRIVSNTFDMAEWEPDERATIEDDNTSWHEALLWIVPAKVQGTWRLPEGKLTISQEFQMISGTLETGGSKVQINGRLRGDQINFTADKYQYTGVVKGNNIEGTVTVGNNKNKWSAALVTN